jgi:hypothetical protein
MVKLIRTAIIFTAGYIMGAGGCDILFDYQKSPSPDQAYKIEYRANKQDLGSREANPQYRLNSEDVRVKEFQR